MKTTVSIFPNLDAFAAHLLSLPYEYGEYCRGYAGRSFLNADSIESAVAQTLKGASEEETREARALLDKIDAETHGRKKSQHVNSVAGHRADVGAYLVGNPLNMKRRVIAEHDRAPIRLIAEVGVSAGVSHENLARRGAALAALAVRLAEVRPVELWAAWAWAPNGNSAYRREALGPAKHTTTGMVRLATNPVSLAEVVAITAKAQFLRACVFTHCAYVAGRQVGSLPWGWNLYDNHSRMLKMREHLGLEPQDILLPGGTLNTQEQFMRDPVAWVNSYLDAQREAED